MELELFKEIPNLKKLYPKYKYLKECTIYCYEKILKNWTKEFQTIFHLSFWEFYLYAIFKKLGFLLNQTYERSDFIIEFPFLSYIEAVISNIKKNRKIEKDRTIDNYLSILSPQNYKKIFIKI